MQPQIVKTCSEAELLARLKKTRLRGFDRPYVYATATLSIVPHVSTDQLVPAQRYVLMPGVRRILDLRQSILRLGVDIFALRGAIWTSTYDANQNDSPIPVLPPIVEESKEPDGRIVWLINDGIHRVYGARTLGLPISIVLARAVPQEYPYYAFALQRGWSDVVELEELPDAFVKKAYRDPSGYKALFRDFNEVFPRVQEERKKSNPGRLKPGVAA